jgi:hypothetical protein
MEAGEMKAAVVALVTGIGLGALAALGVGCSKSEESVASAFDKIGVAECDAYFKAAEACIRKNPTMKAAMEPTMKATHETWTHYAATPQGKDALKTSCKAATDALAASCN